MSILDRLLDLLVSTSIGLATLVFLTLSAVCMVAAVKRDRAAARNKQAILDLTKKGKRANGRR
ncbi:hypothetical protein [Roseibium alexandrii]|uniref:hypothetical protein n=1 Tax=Roseibium alexandrii TaxID=388408 RepID=UPI0037521AF0